MKYGILGTGSVACAIAGKLIELGHEVMMGSRTSNNPQASAWAKQHGEHASHGTFADAAKFGERVFLCVRGIHSIEVLQGVGEELLAGKILFDQANPYLHQDGQVMLDPRWSGNTSLGEEIQKLLPNTKVVKTLNYLGYNMMTSPQELPEQITGFYCGNDKEAKIAVEQLLRDFGWQDTLDLGNISMSRYTEMLGAFWPAAYNALGHMTWGFKLVR
ncbi:NADP oxidoreductase [Histomonas meleagridis]|uniref:NADP oxidoreductase n=1 Tax=Histomonas meleagridis TaxID=135588 RepID=UPI00355A486F|nr:NADP oxidoreductase [Histomonas meleagridis]KAH0803303.1 NADP oxidoreductase [Histomonas meleagridis]